ncbi:hypothetical protein Acj9p025 [Acinetobacter phage Acj9]|uniref:J domain-containing protein n=1 Tax=Acinetobacter phage Acj9 TaxID=760939 RepID=E5EPF9_9CAUD|nr:hypothetical protein Acj9p025 [Acinetobacter phage Acj9]ADG59925.1 hypothetical protein Acj9p025 [Acinetobacter phage Acj9]
MGPVATFICVGLLLCALAALAHSTVMWFQTRSLLAIRTERYNECVRNRNEIKELLAKAKNEADGLRAVNSNNIQAYNMLEAKFLECEYQFNEFKRKAALKDGFGDSFKKFNEAFAKEAPKSVGKNEFSINELKRIRFAIHPDRNGGKNSELWQKINDMTKG